MWFICCVDVSLDETFAILIVNKLHARFLALWLAETFWETNRKVSFGEWQWCDRFAVNHKAKCCNDNNAIKLVVSLVREVWLTLNCQYYTTVCLSFVCIFVGNSTSVTSLNLPGTLTCHFAASFGDDFTAWIIWYLLPHLHWKRRSTLVSLCLLFRKVVVNHALNFTWFEKWND